ncbi:MAG TPA: hypothetical protein VFA04_18430 [Bryobacteraceae bacterium]|jgi:hypothetical protein|nr:hypothetical protein [Bryobacteraceae bacterium]
MIAVALMMMAAAASGNLDRLTHEVAESGRVVELATPPSRRVNPPPRIAPGRPPLLSFRYYEGEQHHRFADKELTLDDAGH